MQIEKRNLNVKIIMYIPCISQLEKFYCKKIRFADPQVNEVKNVVAGWRDNHSQSNPKHRFQIFERLNHLATPTGKTKR